MISHASSLEITPRGCSSWLLPLRYRQLGYIGLKGPSLELGVKFFEFTRTLHDAGLDYRARHVCDVGKRFGRSYGAARAMVEAGDLPALGRAALIYAKDYDGWHQVTPYEINPDATQAEVGSGTHHQPFHWGECYQDLGYIQPGPEPNGYNELFECCSSAWRRTSAVPTFGRRVWV